MKTVIENSYKSILKELAIKANSESVVYLKIVAYADTSVSETHNDSLSRERALVIENYFLKNSRIDSSKFITTWIGESSEVYDLHFPNPNVQKRCVDIWLGVVRK
ncbi:MAG: OmpA family protein [Flavitalea sp.]